MDSTAELDGLKFNSGDALATSRLLGIMTDHIKAVEYKMLSVVDQFPNNIYTLNTICGQNVTYGCGSSVYEAQNDATKKFLDYLESTSTNLPCVECNVKSTAGPYVSKGVGKNKLMAKNKLLICCSSTG